jgi:hypothetical protein
MSDGANQGVMPERALGTILGGKDQPTDEEKLSRQELLEKIRGASLAPDSYDDASLAIARVIVEAIEKYPCLRSVPMEAEYLRDANEKMVWFEDRESPAIHIRPGMYEILEKLHPDESSPERVVMNGMTGFMWGWAYNAAAHVLFMDQQRNPAIVEIPNA